VVTLKAISRRIQEPGKPAQVLFRELSLNLYAGERLAVFSTTNRESAHLLRCVSGVDTPDHGGVHQYGTVSWPVGTDGAFSSKLSGYENVRFALAIYGQPGNMARELQVVEALSGIDRKRLHDPLSSFSGGQKTRLAMAIALALRFDLYPIAKLPGIDVMMPSSQGAILLERLHGDLKDAALLIAGNDLWPVAETLCQEGLVLVNGSIIFRGDLEVCRLMVQEERERLREEERQALLAGNGLSAAEDQSAENGDEEIEDWEIKS
jgi:ABC-type polysaccharide/polyol phosphate transport system ATPase subunit